MKKKILLLTTIYPSPDISITNNTNVVHYFAREWVKMGFEVRVVFNYPIYLWILHAVAALCKNLLASRYNTSVTVQYTDKDFEFELDGVRVIRMPLFKPLPRYRVLKKSMNKQVVKIAHYCLREEFIPDAIIAHNFYPHLEMVNRLKHDHFPNIKSCVVVHKQDLKMLEYVANHKQQIADVDIWGFRSIPLLQDFENFAGKIRKNFICYSGVSSFFLSEPKKKSFDSPKLRIIYIGSFIKRKHADKLLLAIKKAQLDSFHLDLVGEGILKKQLKKYVENEKWNECVEFHGFLPRENIPFVLNNADCFCMISEEETFGLVYLEAMSKGLVTIASRNEGMEGIIINGENGFLCKAGDSDELADILKKIEMMPVEELLRISNNAQETAFKLSDSAVAEMYINSVLNC